MKQTIRMGLLIAAVAVVACGEDDEEQSACAMESASIAALTGNVVSGQTVFLATCGSAACHGNNGDVGPATNLSVAAVGRSAVELATIVNCGAGNMAALNQLSDQDIADVVAYVRATFN